MLHCGIGCWIGLIESSDVVDYRFLAKTTSSIISIASTDIVFLTKLQKRQTPQNGFALFQKRYHRF
jgi:hypothetical protein